MRWKWIRIHVNVLDRMYKFEYMYIYILVYVCSCVHIIGVRTWIWFYIFVFWGRDKIFLFFVMLIEASIKELLLQFCARLFCLLSSFTSTLIQKKVLNSGPTHLFSIVHCPNIKTITNWVQQVMVSSGILGEKMMCFSLSLSLFLALAVEVRAH